MTMATVIKWRDRAFTFEAPAGLFPGFVERLRGTPVRLETLVHFCPKTSMTRRPVGGWCLNEQLGHLINADVVFNRRLDMYLEAAQPESLIDVIKALKEVADYRDDATTELLTEFRRQREAFVRRLEKLDEAQVLKSIELPDIKMTMRLLDLAWFIGEHDDQHLAETTRLIRSLS